MEANIEPRHVSIPFLPQNSPLLQGSPAASPTSRRREDESMPNNMSLGIQKKKLKNKQSVGSPLTPRANRKVDDEKMARRVRESYACLRHRAMHKRCPAECIERRIPKPLPVATERRQAQQSQFKCNSKSPIMSSPTMLNSPNTLRLLQGLQNTRISSPRVSPPHENSSSPISADNFIYNSAEPWDMGMSSSWGSTDASWAEESWNELSASGQFKWEEDGSDKSGVDDEGSSPMQDIEGWLGDANHVTVPGFHYSDDLSDMAHLQQSTQQLLSETFQTPVDDTPVSRLLKILITQEQIERWMFEEHFNKLMRGFYVRVRIAQVNDQPAHRLGCIVEGKDNVFPGSVDLMDNGKGLVVHFGSSGQHVIPVSAVSNYPPTETECIEWLRDAERNNISIMSSEVIEKMEVAGILNGKQSVAYASH